MTALDIFNYDGAQVRTTELDGKPAVVVSDIGTILGYRDANSAARVLRDRQKGYTNVRTPGGMQRMLVTTIEGFNRLIIKSNASNADQVQDWLTDEVMPSIQKTGSYGAQSLSEEEIVHQALAITSRKVKELEAKVEADAPKVLFAESVATSAGSILVAQLGTILNQNGVDIGEKRLFERLRSEGFLCKGGSDHNRPTQRAMDMGLFEVIERTYQSSEGLPRLSITPKVTGKGQVYFINRYTGEKAA